MEKFGEKIRWKNEFDKRVKKISWKIPQKQVTPSNTTYKWHQSKSKRKRSPFSCGQTWFLEALLVRKWTVSLKIWIGAKCEFHQNILLNKIIKIFPLWLQRCGRINWSHESGSTVKKQVAALSFLQHFQILAYLVDKSNLYRAIISRKTAKKEKKVRKKRWIMQNLGFITTE